MNLNSMAIEIEKIQSRSIFDSRGYPTVEVEVSCLQGCIGRAAVPSGASTGKWEAYELRDEKQKYFGGKGVEKALKNIQMVLAPQLIGQNVLEQRHLDLLMCSLSPSPQKKELGANAILGVSMAICCAAANALNLPLYRYLGGANAHVLPIPMMNIINGGQHANNSLDFQEFMIVPYGFTSFKEALACGVEIFHKLKEILRKRSFSTSVGDEGGFAPNLKSHQQALDLILEAIVQASYCPKTQVALALDVAASEFLQSNSYFLTSENRKYDADAMIAMYVDLCKQYPIVSLEDPLGEDDWQAWEQITQSLGDKIQLVGDDLLVTNEKRLSKAISNNIANAILIKANQIGTITETLNTIEMAQKSKYNTIISHRSGETEDIFIAHLAVATNAGQIKTGSLSRTDRLAKYNELLRIEEDLGKQAVYAHSIFHVA